MKTFTKFLLIPKLVEQRGAVVVLVAVCGLVFVGLAALAIDLSHLYVVRNELQNAADAGALAGARVLYNDAGTSVNVNANQEAFDAATANQAISTAGTINVDVEWTSGTNTGDIQRGHWSFGLNPGNMAKGFYPNDSLSSTTLGGRTKEDLDADPDFINAIKVVARRDASVAGGTSAASFFAKIFGFDAFSPSADAVGYIGFAGSLRPADVDQPIAICKQAIYDDTTGTYTCNTGRMINSSGGTTTNTGGWTNFIQTDDAGNPDCPTANQTNVPHNTTTCINSNSKQLSFGEGMGTSGGQIQVVFKDIYDCWKASAPANTDWRGFPTVPMPMSLPVVNCPGNNVGNCSELLGAVDVEVLWVIEDTPSKWLKVPVQMDNWECDLWVDAGRPEDDSFWGNNGTIIIDGTEYDKDVARHACWQDFASSFGLLLWDDSSLTSLTEELSDASNIQKTFFFKPSCDVAEPRGTTGGENYGILAKIPVLVE